MDQFEGLPVEEFKPRAVREKRMEGCLKVVPLSFDERFDLPERYKDLQNSDAAARTKAVREFLKESAFQRIKGVALKRKSDGREFKSLKDLQYGADGHAILIELATWLLTGDDEGNQDGQPSESK